MTKGPAPEDERHGAEATADAPAPAHPSATVVLLRDSPAAAGLEVLLGHRGAELAFHGGDWVFPGGRVDPEDCAAGAPPTSLEAARCAAVRECAEEVGARVAADTLLTWSHWTTPLSWKKRFATWFFFAPFAEQRLAADGVEMQTCRFMRPQDALAQQASGALGLPPPTFVTLVELCAYTSVDQALAAAQTREPPVILPRPQRVADGAISLYPGDVGYDSGALDVTGPQHRLIMRKSGWRYVHSLG